MRPFVLGAALLMVSTGFMTAQSGRSTASKPVVALFVDIESANIGRANGEVFFVVDAVAGGGFKGPISGVIMVSEPANPGMMALKSGSKSQTYPFTLVAGQSTSSTSPPQSGRFTVATGEKSTASGILRYMVSINPSGAFLTYDSPKAVTVNIK